MRRATLGALLLVWLASACARPVAAGQSSAGENSGIDYTKPIPNGVAVPSETAAAAAITSFAVRIPAGLTGTESLFVTPAGTPGNAQAVAFVFQTSEFGLVDVVEGVPEQTTPAASNAANEGLIQQNGQPYTHGTINTVSIRGGEEGFISISEDGMLNTVFWMENGVEYAVEGPTLTSDQAVSVANSV